MEYRSHQQQWLETFVPGPNAAVRPGTSSGLIASDLADPSLLLPTFKKEANTNINTTAGQTVTIHSHLDNMGERAVRHF